MTETIQKLSPAAESIKKSADNANTIAVAVLRALAEPGIVKYGMMEGKICRAISAEEILNLADELEGK